MEKTVVCPKCNLSQMWRGQKNCIHRGCSWSNWDIAVQLKEPYGAGNKPIAVCTCVACHQEIQELPVLDKGQFFHISCWIRRRLAFQHAS